MKTENLCSFECIENKVSVFNVLNKDEKELLKNGHKCYFFKKGSFVYKLGNKPTGLICLSKGKVKIFKEGVGGREQIMRMAKPVGFIGYRALFAEENYRASAMAIEDSLICVFDKDTLFCLIKTNYNLALNIIKAFATDLGFSNNRTVTLTQKHTRGRLAESLIFLKDTYGFEDDNETIRVYLSREDIANLSNMTTSNAIRTLTSFANEKIIGIKRRKIRIIDLVKLEQISETG